MARLAIVGSRGYPRPDLVQQLVAGLKPTTVVVSGGARGVDNWAEQAARKRGLSVDIFPADWQQFGKSAGYIRNRAIIDSVDGVVAFWDGQSRGTAHAIQLARKRGIWLRVYGIDGNKIGK